VPKFAIQVQFDGRWHYILDESDRHSVRTFDDSVAARAVAHGLQRDSADDPPFRVVAYN
jgi:hypothetical protein